MSKKSHLKHSLRQMLRQDRDGSYATRYDRKRLITTFVDDLYKAGFPLEHIQQLKTKHIEAVVAYWQQKALNVSTIKNRLSAVRYVARLLKKPRLVPANAALHIGPRRYVSISNRALTTIDSSSITDTHLRVSVELQRVFGLRREESLKIRPHFADKNTVLLLQPAWCKGGRARIIPIRTAEQRYWLEQAKSLVKENQSLIPEGRSYIQQRYIYDKQINRAGLKNLHGLRHAYAQQRYQELTGWEAPIVGGPKASELTAEQKKHDYAARMVLTEELGHSREQITCNYLGR